MNYENGVNTKDESPLKTLVNMQYARIKQRKEDTNSRAEVFIYIAISIAVIGLIAGIICGIAFPAFVTKDIGTYSPLLTTEKTFNIGLMFAVWAGTAGSVIGCWAISCILEALGNILAELKKIRSYTEYQIESNGKSNTEKE